MADIAERSLQDLPEPRLVMLYRLALELGALTETSGLAQYGLEGCLALCEAVAGLIAQSGNVVAWAGCERAAAEELLAAVADSAPVAGTVSTRLAQSALHRGAILVGGIDQHTMLILSFTPSEVPSEYAELSLTAALPLLAQGFARTTALAQQRRAEASREYMLSLLVHDIRSPLVAAHASIEVSQRLLNRELNPSIFEALKTGLRSVRSAVDLCNDMLEVKRLQAGYQLLRRSLPLSELLADAASLLDGLATQRGCTVSWQVNPPDMQVYGDERLLRRVLVNLIANALRFVPEQRGRVELSAGPVDAATRMCVDDNGSGIAPGEQERIFEAFAQGQGEVSRGTGLGLHFCREVVRSHQGRIWAESSSLGGGRFCIWLPGPG